MQITMSALREWAASQGGDIHKVDSLVSLCETPGYNEVKSQESRRSNCSIVSHLVRLPSVLFPSLSPHVKKLKNK